MINYYEALRASLLSFANGIVTDLQGDAPGLQLVDFDTYNSPGLLPETDLFGPYQFEMIDNGQLIEARTMFMASTLSDTNLFRLNKIVGAAYKKLRPDQHIPFIDGETGDGLGRLVIEEGVTVLPLDQSTNRPMKAIAVAFRSSEPSN